MADDLLEHLRAVVGARHVLDDPDLRAPYETDWTGRWSGRSRAVVRPTDEEQVQGVLRACLAADAPVVAQGGNTGLVGGGVPRGGGTEVVVSLARLDRIGPVDGSSGAVGRCRHSTVSSIGSSPTTSARSAKTSPEALAILPSRNAAPSTTAAPPAARASTRERIARHAARTAPPVMYV